VFPIQLVTSLQVISSLFGTAAVPPKTAPFLASLVELNRFAKRLHSIFHG
jgi:hypothetical protein